VLKPVTFVDAGLLHRAIQVEHWLVWRASAIILAVPTVRIGEQRFRVAQDGDVHLVPENFAPAIARVVFVFLHAVHTEPAELGAQYAIIEDRMLPFDAGVAR